MHPRIPDAHGHWVPAATAALAMGAVNAGFATAGGNQAIAFGEELVDPHRNMGRVILCAALVGGITIALPVVAVAWSGSGHPDIFRSTAPFSAFVTSLAGPVAGKALSAVVTLAVFNALIAQLLFSARLFFSFARDGIFPGQVNAALARVHPASGAPRIAAIVVAVGSGLSLARLREQHDDCSQKPEREIAGREGSARAAGATSLRIEGTVANPTLMRALERVLGPASGGIPGGPQDVWTVPLGK
jgi:amino acid transporter